MAEKPEPLNEGVRKSMRSNKGKGTSPELRVRKALRESGYPGYRLNWKKAPGRPDICYPGRMVAVFVQGCFWHRCPRCNLPAPKHNAEFWEMKFKRNLERDAEKRELLMAEGWTVIDLWECDLKKNFEEVLKPVTDLLDSRPPRRKKGNRFRTPSFEKRPSASHHPVSVNVRVIKQRGPSIEPPGCDSNNHLF